jgi:hypothetical protein
LTFASWGRGETVANVKSAPPAYAHRYRPDSTVV